MLYFPGITLKFNQSVYSINEDMKLVKIVLVLSNPISTAITLKINESDITANSKWIYVFGAKINSDFGIKTEKMHGYTVLLT